MLVTKQFWVLLTSIVWTKNKMEVNATWKGLDTNIFFCVLQKKEMHTGLEWLEDE